VDIICRIDLSATVPREGEHRTTTEGAGRRNWNYPNG
jgi:hypothetical protein